MPPRMRRGTQTTTQQSSITSAMQTKPSYATIIDLPNEILIMIFEDLTESDLYNLALLCRRLHPVALSLYFEKREVFIYSNGGDLSIRHNTLDMAAVRLALFVHSLSSLYCRVSANNKRKTCHLQRLILRMSEVSTVHIDFTGPGPDRSFTNPLPILLKALENKNCRSLSVSGVPHVTFTHRPNARLPPIVTLTSCQIAHPVLLLPRWLDWTAKSLQSSPLTCLEITNCTVELANALPSFTLPHLSQLYLACDNLPVSVLASFLSRHPTIQTLKIMSLELDGPITTQLFPSLTSLHGDTIGVTHLLAEPMSCPHLKIIQVLDLMDHDSASIVEFLTNVARTPTSYLSIHLVVSLDLKLWLRSFRLSPRGNLAGIDLTRITGIQLVCAYKISDLTVHLPLWVSLFPELHALDLETWFVQEPRMEEKLALIEHLCAECPQIRTVTFNGDGGTLEEWRSGKLRYIRSPVQYTQWRNVRKTGGRWMWDLTRNVQQGRLSDDLRWLR